MNQDYISKIMSRSNEEIQRLNIISGMALDMLIYGINAKKNGEYDNAREYFSISWAFHSKQEYLEGMEICNKLLINLGVNEDELPKYHDFGTEFVNFSMNLVNLVDKKLNKPQTFDFKVPFKL